jgi:hypothetical protein
MIVRAAAAELGRLSLADALAVTLVFLDGEPQRFDRAAVRWHARYCLEHQPGPDESQLLLSALRALSGPARDAAVPALAEMFRRRGLDGAATYLRDLLADSPRRVRR